MPSGSAIRPFQDRISCFRDIFKVYNSLLGKNYLGIVFELKSPTLAVFSSLKIGKSPRKFNFSLRFWSSQKVKCDDYNQKACLWLFEYCFGVEKLFRHCFEPWQADVRSIFSLKDWLIVSTFGIVGRNFESWKIHLWPFSGSKKAFYSIFLRFVFKHKIIPFGISALS